MSPLLPEPAVMPPAETACRWYKHVTSSSQTFTKCLQREEPRIEISNGRVIRQAAHTKKNVREKREQETRDKLKQFRKIQNVGKVEIQEAKCRLRRIIKICKYKNN